VVGYQHCGEPCCLHPHLTLKMEVASFSETWYPTTSWHGVTTQKTSSWIFIVVKTSNLRMHSIASSWSGNVWPLGEMYCFHFQGCPYIHTEDCARYFLRILFPNWHGDGVSAWDGIVISQHCNELAFLTVMLSQCRIQVLKFSVQNFEMCAYCPWQHFSYCRPLALVLNVSNVERTVYWFSCQVHYLGVTKLLHLDGIATGRDVSKEMTISSCLAPSSLLIGIPPPPKWLSQSVSDMIILSLIFLTKLTAD